VLGAGLAKPAGGVRTSLDSLPRVVTRRYPQSVAQSFDLEDLETIGVGTIGPPGQRQFYLRASGGGETVVLNCEKYHVQGLLTRLRQLLEAQGQEPPAEAAGAPPPAQPGESAWTIGELGLGYHESRGRFVIVAREVAESDDVDPETLATARFWVTADQIKNFSQQADAVLQGGRPACQYCGLPIDPAGHPCPAANGSRPIL
jgi:uncharacterized repeat protein (TIGR03847 family)